MQKKISMLLVALITLFMLSAIVPARASTGNILVSTKTAPSPVVTIKLGGSVSLYFGKVTWSGGTIDLYISTNGYSYLNYTTDIKYGPTFSVAKLQSSTIDSTTYYVVLNGIKYYYSVGLDWINGTVPTSLPIPGGHYYVKAFDGTTASVAVTDNYINIIAAFQVIVRNVPYNYPKSGPGNAQIYLMGYALPVYGYANLSYFYSSWVTIKNLYPADAVGRFNYSMLAPDLLKALPLGPHNEAFDTITFRMIVNKTGQTETDIFKEGERGLKQVKGVNQALALNTPSQLYGNLTSFGPTPTAGAVTVNVKVKGSLIIAGKWFHPGTSTLWWDNAIALGTATANATGWFNVTVTVPITGKGSHNVTINEGAGKCVFVFWVNVIPTLILVPDSGPVGTSVTAYGYGFPASTTTVVYNATLWWDYVDSCKPVPVALTWALTSSLGNFTVGFAVPHTVGGAHTVTAITNDTALTWASATFTVTPNVIVSPNVFLNNGTPVTITGTGLANGTYYDLCLDNAKDFDAFNLFRTAVTTGANVPANATAGTLTYFICDCTGDFSFKIIGAGFQPGIHVVSLYQAKLNVAGPAGYLPTLTTWQLFNVTSPEENLILENLNETLTAIAKLDTNLGSNSTAILAKLATIQSALAAAQSALSTQISSGNSALSTALAAAQSALSTALAAAQSALSTQITGLSTQIAPIATSAATAATRADAAATSAGNAATYAQGAQTAAQAAQSATSTISTAVYAAIVLALIAALASIVAVITLQRKVA